MADFYPLRFEPIFRRYLWGGRRLATLLSKPIGRDNCAESWEVADRPEARSVVAAGPLAGRTLGELIRCHGPEILGRHDPRPFFPLLVKFLDARDSLSIQVHPDDARAARLTPPDIGKTEAWVVIDAEPGGLVYAGLKPGVDRKTLHRETLRGNCLDCLHSFEPAAGDCIFLPAGTVHALGAGILIAEVQQPSDATFRLFDFNRVDAGGKPRELHIDMALDAIDYDAGPVSPRAPQPAELPHVERLVACEKFELARWKIDSPVQVGGDGRFHIFVGLDGECEVDRDATGGPLRRGATVLLPAAAGSVLFSPKAPTVLLHAYLP